MSAEQTSADEMGPWGRAIGVFISPRETFESIDRKPTWLVPFLIVVIASIILQLLVLDIGIQDRLAMMEAQELSAERLEAARTQMAGPLRYMGVAITPVAVLVIWAVLGGIFLFTGNTIMGGEAKFKKVFSLIAWTSLIGVFGPSRISKQVSISPVSVQAIPGKPPLRSSLNWRAKSLAKMKGESKSRRRTFSSLVAHSSIGW